MLERGATRRLRPRLSLTMLGAALTVGAGMFAIGGASAGGQPPTLKDCEQTDSSPLVVRACSHILNGQALDPAERKRILFMRARAWIMEEDFHAAADDYSGVLEIEPGNVAALEGRAKAYGRGGEHAKAADDWSTLLAANPQNGLYYRKRGTERIEVKQFEEALADFGKSLEIDPKAIDAYVGRAQTYNAIGDREKAKAEFDKGIAIDDRQISLFWIRGEMARAWGDKDLAIASYTRVLQINSLHEDARRRIFNLGVLHPP